MTTLQKTVVATVLAAAVGVGIYEARQAAAARSEMQTLRQQHAEQLRLLQSQHEDATNRLAWLTEEVAKGKSNRLDYLRLRGETGRLRQTVKELEQVGEQNRLLKEALEKASQGAQQGQIEPDAFKARQIQHMNDAKQLLLGLVMYAGDHGDLFPSELSATSNYHGAGSARLMTNQFDLLISGSLTSITNPAATLALRHRPIYTNNGMAFRIYGFADGHVETRREPPEGFEAWEKQRLLSVPADR